MNATLTPSNPTMRFDVSRRLNFLSIDRNCRTIPAGLWPVIESHLPELIDGFYTLTGLVPKLAGKVGVSSNIPILGGARIVHWQAVFSGRSGCAYFSRVTRLGHSKRKIALEPRRYLGGCRFILERLATICLPHFESDREARQKAIGAMSKAVLLDMETAR